jgi:DNA-directed RNA polymerase subunit omega
MFDSIGVKVPSPSDGSNRAAKRKGTNRARVYPYKLLDQTPRIPYSRSTMVMPLDLLMSFKGNIYEMTCAAMKRGVQINLIGDEDLEPNRGKIVSTAIKQVLLQKVQYRFEA